MSLFRSLIPARSNSSVVHHRADDVLSWEQYQSYFAFGNFPFFVNNLGANEEEISQAYTSLMTMLLSNGPVYACEVVRVMLFSEARFLFRQRESGHPGDLFFTRALEILERPDGPGSTTASMLKRVMLDADFGGTGFLVMRPTRIAQPRPDWMTVVSGSYEEPAMTGDDIDAEIIGYIYHPGGLNSGQRPKTFLPEEVATFIPMPDRTTKAGGIPWTASALKYVKSHNSAATFKQRFFDNGATPQLVVGFEGVSDPKKLREWIEVLDQDHKGVTNAYKTLYLGAGAKAQVVGRDLQQITLKETQGADETLIAAAAGVGPVVAQLSEGLQGSSLNAGNFAQAMRRVADITMRPLWRDMAGSLEVFVPPPGVAQLWYDDSDIPALKDDIKDRAVVIAQNANAIRTLWDGGGEPQSVIDAVVANDLKRIKHTGKLSVQLQEPGKPPASSSAPPAAIAGPPPVPLLGSGEVRCPSCDKLVARALGPGTDLDCPRCKAPIVA